MVTTLSSITQSIGRVNYSVSLDEEEVPVALYELLRTTGLVTEDEGLPAHPNFAMTSLIMKRKINSVVMSLLPNISTKIEFTQ